MALKEIKCIVKHVAYDDSEGKKHEFDSYKAVKSDGKTIDLRFTQEVTKKPTETCIIVVDEKNMNIATTYEFPRLWVKKIEEIKPIPTKKEDLPF